MTVLTVRVPEDKAMRLKALARQRKISVNQLMNELATRAITEFDVETRFRTLAARGDAKAGLAALDRIEKAVSD
jgi:predicted transcriptional regulator